jgi:hypothetical protein
MRLKMRLDRLEARQTIILARLPPERPKPDPLLFEAFMQAIKSGLVGRIDGIDLDAFRSFIECVNQLASNDFVSNPQPSGVFP